MKTIRDIFLALVIAVSFAQAARADSAENVGCCSKHAEKTVARDVDNDYRSLSFAWGSDLAGNVDLSSHNMSAIGLSAEVGMQWRWIRFLGVGAEGNVMVSNSSRSFPIFVNFRTDFSNHRRLFFMDLRGGMAINYFIDDKHETGAYVSGGLGVTLAEGKAFSSHIILAYTYLSQEQCYNGNYLRDCPGISMVTLRLGVAF